MKKGFVIFIILCSIHFYEYYLFSPSFLKLTDVCVILLSIYSLVTTSGSKIQKFRPFIIIYLIGLVLNVLSAYQNHGQSIRDTALTGFPFYFIVLYFFLHDQNIQKKDVENLIIVLGILYALLYLWQYNAYPRRILNTDMFRDRGTIRMRFEGSGFLVLAYFMTLNRFLINRKIINIGIALFLFAIFFRAGYRSLSAALVVLSAVLYLRLINKSVINYLMVVVIAILFVGVLQMEENAQILENMISASEEQQEQGDQYIRKMARNFFSTVYPQNSSYYIFGGGLPGAYGAYAYYMGSLVELYGFYWVDLGLIGFYYVVGGVALLGILLYTLFAIFTKLPSNYLYLNFFFAYLLLVSYHTSEIFRPGMFAVEALVLYMIDIIRHEKKSEQNPKSILMDDETSNEL